MRQRMLTYKHLCCGIALLCIGWTASATHETGYYRNFAGVAASKTRLPLNAYVPDNSQANIDESSNGMQLYVGRRFSPYLFGMVTYTDAGNATISGVNGDSFFFNDDPYYLFANDGSAAIDFNFRGLDIAFGIGWPLLWVYPYGKFGVFRWEVETLADENTASPPFVNETTVGLLYGAGVDVPLNRRLFIRGDITAYNFDGRTPTIGSVSINYAF